MTNQPLPLQATGAFPNLFLDYISQEPALCPFFDFFPTIENFGAIIEAKKFSDQSRETLVEVLQKQYGRLQNPSVLPELTALASPNTFTVTTGHQLNIFTGPLYVIYKIVTVINLAKRLKAAYPDQNFVPIYWMASEDHDFAEIASFNLFGKKYKWETKQRGAVGRMNPHELGGALDILPERVPLFEQAYLKHPTLADAVRFYMNELFGAEGLVCLDADDRTLKKLFRPVLSDELLNGTSSEKVAQTTALLTELGYQSQISGREINLFYLADQLRERIARDADKAHFRVLNTDLVFTEAEMLRIVENEPEKLSPNVVLRPVYQECILPNLAYIGGPSEVPYWLQLKGVFAHFALPMPALMPRNFVLFVTTAHQKRIEKLGISVTDLFLDETALRHKFIGKVTTHTLDLNAEKQDFEELFERINQKAVAVDKTMEGVVQTQKVRLVAALQNMEKRIRRAEERHYETELGQLQALQTKLFPGGSLQERSDNVLNFLLNDATFIQKCLDNLDPLAYQFNVLFEDAPISEVEPVPS